MQHISHKKNISRKREIIDFLEQVKWFGFRKLYWVVTRGYIRMVELLTDVHIIFPSRHQALIKRRICRQLIQHYNGDFGHNINLTQYFLGFGLIHYAFIRNTKPRHILCIGSRKGYIPAIFALACKDNRFGHVDFVDAGYDRDQADIHWSGIGFWKKIDPIWHFSQIRVGEYITTHVMTTAQYAKKFPKKRYQYIYVDGDHSYTGVKRDYSLFWPKLDKGGFMSFHDVVATGYLDKGLFGVWKFWREIKKQCKIVFPFPKESGLGFIQK